jgi:hypothetical protein
LRRFVRRLYFLKPDVLIVVDDVEADRERALELRFHPEFPGRREDDGAILCPGERAALRIAPLTTEGVEVAAGDLPSKDRSGGPATMFTVKLAANRREWRNAVAFSWVPAGKEPPRVTLETAAEAWTFHAGGRSAVCRW